MRGEWPVRDEAEGASSSRALFIGHGEEFGFFKGIMETTEGLHFGSGTIQFIFKWIMFKKVKLKCKFSYTFMYILLFIGFLEYLELGLR